MAQHTSKVQRHHCFVDLLCRCQRHCPCITHLGGCNTGGLRGCSKGTTIMRAPILSNPFVRAFLSKWWHVKSKGWGEIQSNTLLKPHGGKFFFWKYSSLGTVQGPSTAHCNNEKIPKKVHKAPLKFNAVAVVFTFSAVASAVVPLSRILLPATQEGSETP